MSTLTHAHRERFAKVLGMLGSAHAGERDAAALRAENMRRELGISWHDIVAPPPAIYAPPPPEPPTVRPWRQQVADCLKRREALTSWELKFLHDIQRRTMLTCNQRDTLDKIVAAVLGGDAQ